LPAPTSNLCFGGPDGTDMFITATDTVWRVRTTRRDAATCLRNQGPQT
jgi:gluconolactonase